MAKIELRFPKVSDATRYCEILNNPHPHFLYFGSKPTLDQEQKWLRECAKRRKKNFDHAYAIIRDGELIGGCGIKINQHRKYIGEIGYFLDEKFWGKGIVPKAVKLLEKICFQKLGIKRIEIVMRKENKASERVAIKCGYLKEGLMKKALKTQEKFYDCFLYAKVK